MVAGVQTQLQLQLQLQLLLLRTVSSLPTHHARMRACWLHPCQCQCQCQCQCRQSMSMYARMSVDVVFSPSMLHPSRSGDPPWATRLPYSRQHCLRLTERPAEKRREESGVHCMSMWEGGKRAALLAAYEGIGHTAPSFTSLVTALEMPQPVGIVLKAPRSRQLCTRAQGFKPTVVVCHCDFDCGQPHLQLIQCQNVSTRGNFINQGQDYAGSRSCAPRTGSSRQ